MTGLKRPKLYGVATEQLEVTFVPVDGLDWLREQANHARKATFGGVEHTIHFRCKDKAPFCPSCKVVGHHPGRCKKKPNPMTRRDKKNPWGAPAPAGGQGGPQASLESEEFPELPQTTVPEAVGVASVLTTTQGAASVLTTAPGAASVLTTAPTAAPLNPPMGAKEDANKKKQKARAPTPPPPPQLEEPAEEDMDVAVNLKRAHESPDSTPEQKHQRTASEDLEEEEERRKELQVDAKEVRLIKSPDLTPKQVPLCKVHLVKPRPLEKRKFLPKEQALRCHGSMWIGQNREITLHIISYKNQEGRWCILHERAMDVETINQDAMVDTLFYDFGIANELRIPTQAFVNDKWQLFKSAVKQKGCKLSTCENSPASVTTCLPRRRTTST